MWNTSYSCSNLIFPHCQESLIHLGDLGRNHSFTDLSQIRGINSSTQGCLLPGIWAHCYWLRMFTWQWTPCVNLFGYLTCSNMFFSYFLFWSSMPIDLNYKVKTYNILEILSSFLTWYLYKFYKVFLLLTVDMAHHFMGIKTKINVL